MGKGGEGEKMTVSANVTENGKLQSGYRRKFGDVSCSLLN